MTQGSPSQPNLRTFGLQSPRLLNSHEQGLISKGYIHNHTHGTQATQEMEVDLEMFGKPRLK